MKSFLLLTVIFVILLAGPLWAASIQLSQMKSESSFYLNQTPVVNDLQTSSTWAPDFDVESYSLSENGSWKFGFFSVGVDESGTEQIDLRVTLAIKTPYGIMRVNNEAHGQVYAYNDFFVISDLEWDTPQQTIDCGGWYHSIEFSPLNGFWHYGERDIDVIITTDQVDFFSPYNPVPIPPSFYFFVSGLTGLILMNARKNKNIS